MALPAILAAACELGKVTIPTKPPSVVVHAVLNPGAPEQIVFLEHTLTGQTQVGKPMYDPADPIASAGGIPVEFARVEIIDSSGVVVVGHEQERGVYHVPIVGGLLRLGARYQLHVRTQEGEDVTAFTRIPAPEVTTTGGLTRTVNRDHDTVNVSWSPAEQTRAYAMRVESPFGPFFLFTDSLHVRLTGDLRNLFAGELQHVLVPGFHEDLLIAAVDSNFFDYYRTNNDPFTGAGIISRINGGIGLFGSLVTLTNGTLTVIADQTEPIEGRYRVTTGFNAAPAGSINLYVESPPAKSGAPAALTGRYTAQSFPPHADGIVGSLRGTTVSFALLLNQLAADTADVFVGQLQNGTLTGAFQKAGPAVYVKQ